MKTAGIAAKEGRTVVAFDVDPQDPRIKFLREVEKFVDGKLEVGMMLGGDIILHAVRIALDQPEYHFAGGARREWKALAFPLLYGMRGPRKFDSAPLAMGDAHLQAAEAMFSSFREAYGTSFATRSKAFGMPYGKGQTVTGRTPSGPAEVQGFPTQPSMVTRALAQTDLSWIDRLPPKFVSRKKPQE